MSEGRRRFGFLALGLTTALIASAPLAATTVNRSISIGDGESVASGLSSVNGSIRIGSGAEVHGTSRSVNGSIAVRSEARVGHLDTVNGSIRLADGVVVAGDVSSVNGSVVATGAEIGGDVTTVNGSLELRATTVTGSLETHNGRVTLESGSRLMGHLVIRGSRGFRRERERPLEIHLRGGSVIEGDLRSEPGARPVRVYLDSASRILGSTAGAELIRR
jgi:DUF4097 and DUF4098 domain-containing protein YvlB